MAGVTGGPDIASVKALVAQQGGGRQIIWQQQTQPNVLGFTKAYITFEEEHNDESYITEHPVEVGVMVTDHAYSRQPRLTLRISYGPSGPEVPPLLAPQLSGLPTTSQAGVLTATQTVKSYLSGLYGVLKGLQSNKTLLAVLTGKRTYTNMLIELLRVDTDLKKENVLAVTMYLRQLFFAQTVVTSVPPGALHQSPQNTAPPVNAGTVQLQPAPNYNSTQGAAALAAG